MSRESLVRRFADAGLTLVLSDRPIVGGIRGAAREIVQIDIQRTTNGSRRTEWFRIFPGAEENRIEVVGTDKRIGQVVLMVHETAREFCEKWTCGGVEGDARRYRCGSCGERAVHGAEEALLMNRLVFI